METIFNESIDNTDKYKPIFDEPFDIDIKSTNYKWSQKHCHFIDAYFIYNKISESNRLIIKDNIDCFYFIYVDFGMDRWDEKYWFCIGKTKDDLYFSYESTCCGTGFGLGSRSKIYYSKDKNMLLTYGIENIHRDFIEKHKKIFLNIEHKLD